MVGDAPSVIPAQAGIQSVRRSLATPYNKVSLRDVFSLDSRLRGNDGGGARDEGSTPGVSDSVVNTRVRAVPGTIPHAAPQDANRDSTQRI